MSIKSLQKRFDVYYEFQLVERIKKMNNIWRDKKMALQIKLRLYDSIVKTILLCGAETWPMSHAG